MGLLKFTILGCGSSGGVPRIGGNWGACDSSNSKNRRGRCSLLIQLQQNSKETRVLIDTSPDLREQMLNSGVGTLDAVVYTHAHADHVNGLDDLRMIFLNNKKRVPIWADQQTLKALKNRFGYAFTQPEGSDYPPILQPHLIEGPVEIDGNGGRIKLIPFPVLHGGIIALGFRIGPLTYTPDVSEMLPSSWSVLKGSQCWVVDALRRRPHPSHVHLEQTLEWIRKENPPQAILTNMHIDLDYQTLLDETPSNVAPAYDGMSLVFEI